MHCRCFPRFMFKSKPYHGYQSQFQHFSTKVLPLTVLKRKDLDYIDSDKLMDIIQNVGFLKLEIKQDIRNLLEEIEDELKVFYKEINYGETLHDKQMLSHWWPQQSLFFGYSNHYNEIIPNQFEQFHINPRMMHDELNPFREMKNVMTLFDYLCNESYEIFEKIWLKLEIFSLDDFETIIGGKQLNQTIAINRFHPDTLRMNKNVDELMPGLREHCDSGFLSILKNAGPGFQVFYNEEWYDIDYSDKNDNFVLNFGSLIAETTKYSKFPLKACRHRVLPITDYQRLTIAIFNDADWNGMMYRYDENQQLYPYKTYKSHLHDVYAEIGSDKF